MPEPVSDEPLLGRYEAAALLAVDGANGGTLAGIEQIFETFERLFQRRPGATQIAASFALLCDAGLVEYTESELGLTSHGRKLLRRAGLLDSPDRPARVADLLGELEEADLAAPGTVAAPSEEDVRTALTNLASDDDAGAGPVTGDEIAPAAIGAPLVPFGLAFGQNPVSRVAGRRLMFRRHVDDLPDVPEAPMVGGGGDDPRD